METAASIEKQILLLLESSIEDTRVPDAIATHADKRAGKLVTRADAAQLEEQLGLPVRISRQYGMTHVTWTTSDGDTHSILLAHSDTNVHWPTATALRVKEPAYFTARDERNTARKRLLEEHQDPSARESYVKRASAVIIKLREARKELLELTDYDQPMNVIRSVLEKLAEKL